MRATACVMRAACYQLVVWRAVGEIGVPNGEVVEVELYDRQINPPETLNVAQDEKYRADAKRLIVRLNEHWSSIREP